MGMLFVGFGVVLLLGCVFVVCFFFCLDDKIKSATREGQRTGTRNKDLLLT